MGAAPSAPATRPVRPPATSAPAPVEKKGPKIGPEFFATVEILASTLDSLDYFRLFGLETKATPREVKDAYYRESRLYHPDRFHQLPDEELKARVTAIFKRITEAYVVLRDDAKRAKYIADLASAERSQKLRYTEASEAEQKAEQRKAVVEQIGTTPKGRDCYKLGMKEFDAKRYDGAMRQFKMALMYEPANEKYKEKFKESEQLFDKNRPRNDFKIK